MILTKLSCLAVILPFACASTLSIRQSGLAVDSLTADKSTLLGSGAWERVIVGVPGQNPAPVLVRCDAHFGAGVEARSCFDALNFAPYGVQQEIWLANNAPAGHPGNRLPMVILSNDTSCFIVPRLQPPQSIGHASAFNISEAARAVIRHCVIPRRIGGQARNIGGDNKLNVDVYGTHEARAECGQPIRATTRSCGYILDEMRRDGVEELFARPGIARLTVALPLTLRSPDGLCQIVIDTAMPSFGVLMTWSRVWFGAELITAACVRGGKGGRAAIPGKDAVIRAPSSALRVTIMDEPTQLVLPGGEDDTAQGSASRAGNHSVR